jgi:hypothetical protein
MASTFLKSLSLSTPLLDAFGASTSIAMPRASGRIHPLPPTLPVVFRAAVTPIGSTSTMVDKHSSTLRALLGRPEPGLRHFCTTRARSGALRQARLVVLHRLLCIIWLREEQGCA